MNDILDALAPDGADEGIWTIDNDSSADWAIRTIKESDADFDRQILVVEEEIGKLELLKQSLEQRKESSVDYLKNKLHEYFMTVKTKETKTQKSYALPSGKLIHKYGTIDFQKDDEKMLAWVKENRPALVKVKESCDWAEFKKSLQVTEAGVITDDGEILDFIKAEQKADKFEVK